MRERLVETRNAGWALVLPVVIIGGLKVGWFTPTEAAVIAAAYSLFVGVFIYREIKIRELCGLMYRAAETTAVIMFLVAAAGVSAWLITTANIPQQVADMVAPFMENKILLMAIPMVMVLSLIHSEMCIRDRTKSRASPSFG